LTTVRTMVLLAAAALCAACADNLTCDEPQRYEFAREGVRVDAPDDLADPDSAKELQIPRASPRDPRPDETRCLDLPPRLQTQSSS